MGRNDSLQLSKSWQIRPNTYVHLTPAEDWRVWPSEAPLAPIPAPKTPAAQTISIANLGLFPSSAPSSLEQSSLSNLTEFSFVQSGSKKDTGSGAEKTRARLRTHRLPREQPLCVGR